MNSVKQKNTEKAWQKDAVEQNKKKRKKLPSVCSKKEEQGGRGKVKTRKKDGAAVI